MTSKELVEKLAPFIDECWKYAAMDGGGEWSVYREKPTRKGTLWDIDTGDDQHDSDPHIMCEILLNDEVFDFEDLEGFGSWEDSLIDLDQARYMPVKKPEAKKKDGHDRIQALEI